MSATPYAGLLPCPFCGGEPTLDDWNTSYRPDSKPLWGVVCKSSKCAGEIGFFNADRAIAVEDWNTRPKTDDVREALPLLNKAFRTTTSGPSGYTMEFRFPDIETLHAADDEWHAHRKAEIALNSDAPSQMERGE